MKMSKDEKNELMMESLNDIFEAELEGLSPLMEAVSKSKYTAEVDEAHGTYGGKALQACPAGHRYVYVCAVDSGDALNSAIIRLGQKMYDKKASYGHVAISFDKSLTHMYAFQYGKSNGFRIESLKNRKPSVVIGVFRIAVPKDVYEVMLDTANNVGATREDYKYNLKGVAGFFAKKHLDKFKSKDHLMFCSQFIARIFAMAGMPIFDKGDHKVEPFAFDNNSRFDFCYRGTIAAYDHKKIR